MTRWLREPAAKPADLSSVPGPMWWVERNSSTVLSPDLYVCIGMHVPTCAHTQFFKGDKDS